MHTDKTLTHTLWQPDREAQPQAHEPSAPNAQESPLAESLFSFVPVFNVQAPGENQMCSLDQSHRMPLKLACLQASP